MFRFKRAIPVGYEEQGYIYFLSKRYKRLPLAEQKTVLRHCANAGGEYYQALFEFVTTDSGATAVCQKHFLSQSTLERIVRKYYVEFAREL